MIYWCNMGQIDLWANISSSETDQRICKNAKYDMIHDLWGYNKNSKPTQWGGREIPIKARICLPVNSD